MPIARKRTSSPKLSKNPRPDRRLAKTRASLAHAFFSLIQQRDWDDIAVQDICEAANVARSSFYAHFDSKAALLDDMILRALAASRESRPPQTGSVAFVGWIVDHVTQNRGMFYRVSRGGGAQIVLTRFKSALCAELAEELKREGSARPEFSANFILGGCFDVLIAWSKMWKVGDLPALKSDILSMSTATALRKCT